VGISWKKHSRKPLNFYKKLVKRMSCEEIGKQDLRKSRNIIQGRRSVLDFLKREPILEKFEQEHIKSKTTPSVDFVVSNETNKRSMSSAKPLREFEPMDWVPIDYK
jgi:hypothetical protein